MFDSLTTNNIKADAVEYANEIAIEKNIEGDEAIRATVDRLSTLWKKENDELNWYFDQMTGRPFGMPLDVDVAIMESQKRLATLTVQITHLCKFLNH